MRHPTKVQKSSISQENPPERREDTATEICSEGLQWNRYCETTHSWDEAKLFLGGPWYLLVAHCYPRWQTLWGGSKYSHSFRLLTEYFLPLLCKLLELKKQIHLGWVSRCWYMTVDLRSQPQAYYAWMHRPEGVSQVALLVKDPPANAGDKRSMVGKIPWKRAWQPTPVFLSGESHGQSSLAGYSPQDCKLLNTAEVT